MTREDAKKIRQRKFRVRIIFLLSCCLTTFLLGFFTHWCICKFSHETVHRVELSGSATIYCVSECEPCESTEGMESIEEPKVETQPEETKVEEETKEFVSHYTYTEEELDLLARLIEAEGGAESYDTKLKIGSVVMNRVDSETFPDTIREVIYQKNQFSVTTHKINGVIMIDRPADEDSKRAAKEVLDYGSVLPPDVQVFFATSVKKGWVTTREVYGIYDKTVFSYIYAKGEGNA